MSAATSTPASTYLTSASSQRNAAGRWTRGRAAVRRWFAVRNGAQLAQPAPHHAVGLPTVASAGKALGDYSAELIGTAILIFVVVAAIDVSFGPGRNAEGLAGDNWRFLFVGAIAGLTVGLLAISPLGKRSGAHLNPAVTIAFWMRGMMRPRDVAGYIGAQMSGAIAGVVVARYLLGGAIASPSVNYGVTRPGHGWDDLSATIGEVLLTAALVAAIQLSLCRPRTAPWTPVIVGVVVTLLIWQAAPFTGAGLNPARGLGPDIVAGRYPSFEVYLLGPTLGAVLAAMAVSRLAKRRPVSIKLCH
jgi:aquaporin Z